MPISPRNVGCFASDIISIRLAMLAFGQRFPLRFWDASISLSEARRGAFRAPDMHTYQKCRIALYELLRAIYEMQSNLLSRETPYSS